MGYVAKNIHRNGACGIGLVEICFFILGCGLMFGAVMPTYRLYENHKHLDVTNANLAQVQIALDSFYQQKGYFPCPAPRNVKIDAVGYGQQDTVTPCAAAIIASPLTDGTVQASVTNASTGVATPVRIGALPVRALGLPDSADLDGWGHRLIYALTEPYGGLATVPQDMNSGVVTIQDSKGINATSSPGNVVYAVVARGADSRGAYNSDGLDPQACDTAVVSGKNCSDTGTFAVTTLTSNAAGSVFTDLAVYRAGLGSCVHTIFGNFCNAGGQGHAYFYNIAAPPGGGNIVNVSYMTAANRIKNLELYTNYVNVPDQPYTIGFPGFPSLTQWFGTCWNGTYTAPETGNYVFTALADDGIEVYIDNNVVTGTIPPPVVEDELNVRRTPPNFGAGYGANLQPAFPGDSTPEYSVGNAYPLTAGTAHSIMIKYYQSWPVMLGAQVFVFPPSQAASVPTPAYLSTATLTSMGLRTTNPPDPNLLYFTAPPTTLNTPLTSPPQVMPPPPTTNPAPIPPIPIPPTYGPGTVTLVPPANYQCPH